MKNKEELYSAGVSLIQNFLITNKFNPIKVTQKKIDKRIHACAYYRDSEITIDIARCSHIGTGGRSWSYPGYVVDRTPYGVLAHELGHHMDRLMGYHSSLIRSQTGEAAISGYSPNDAEWYAEMFRLFITNPHLLERLRPKTHHFFTKWYPVETRPWYEVLDNERQRNAAQNKIRAMRL